MRFYHSKEYYSQMFELEPIDEIPKTKMGKKRVDYDEGQLANVILKDFMDSGNQRAKIVFTRDISQARNAKDFAERLRSKVKDWQGNIHYPINVYVRTDKIKDPYDIYPAPPIGAKLVRIFLERTDH